jgi:hypothetical protein
MSKKRRIYLNIDEDILQTCLSLRIRVVKDKELSFWKAGTISVNAWLEKTIECGNIKFEEDFKKWKKMQGIQDGS